MTTFLGYARVSTAGQDLDAQLVALTGAGVGADQVFTDKLSGAVSTDRPGLTAMLHYVRAGDTVVVTAIDRLGRSVAEVTRTIAELGERRIPCAPCVKAWIRALQPVVPWLPSWRLWSELELELGRERRAASRESRRSRQEPATRPTKLTADRQEQLRRLAATGEPVRELGAAFGIARATAYRYMSPHFGV